MEMHAQRVNRAKCLKGLQFYIETYGCQMNMHDSEKIAGILSTLGGTQTKSKKAADIIVFNTCCVRENAENKLYGNVGKLKAVKAKRPDLILCVCGCMMQQPGAAEKLAGTFPFVDILFGTTNMDKLPDMLETVLYKRHRCVEVCADKVAQENVAMLRNPPPLALVNIMQGCDNFCSYCIVPYVRGREHSRPMEAVVREVSALKEQGYREVMLLGQNVNSYGKGQPGAGFPELLDAVARTGIERIRFMTSHPKDVSDALIEQMAAHDTICKQLHLPVQSGSTRILGRMNRKYTREAYLALVEKIRRRMPGIVLSTDIIVGFPGETEADFLATLSLVREVRFDSAFTFVYSKRTGTEAADFEGQVPEEIKKDRIMRLIEMQSAITYESNLACVGRTARILVEGASTRDKAAICGRTDGGKMVNAKGPATLTGSFVNVKITGARKTSLLGKILDADTPAIQ